MDETERPFTFNKDTLQLAIFYERFNKGQCSLEHLSFLEAIVRRTNLEGHLQQKKQAGKTKDYQYNYAPEAFPDWLNDECWYEMERREKRREHFSVEKVRDATLTAITKRAIEYFSEYGVRGDIREKGENIRCSLEPYFKKFNL